MLPLRFHNAEAAQLPKHNNKHSCAGTRLVFVYDGFANVVMKFKLASGAINIAMPRKHGFLPKRCREGEMCVQEVLSYRLDRCGCSNVYVFLGISSAFTSANHDELVKAYQKLLSDEADALNVCDNIAFAVFGLQCPDQILTLRPRCG